MEDLIAILILGTFISLLVIDTLRPARELPTVRRWRIKGIAFFVLNAILATLLPLAWSGVLAEHQLIDASGLGTIGGAIVGILVLDFVLFAWHFALHRSNFLWRWFHQVHHSAERIDTAGAFYLSPLDIFGFTFVTSLALVWLVGVSLEAALIANGVLTFLAIFQHANVRTPRWLGYIVQRPEAHGIHHGRDIHGFNYGNFALWDLICGTWRNPKTYSGKAGFFDGSSAHLGTMLRGRDLAAEHAARTSLRMWTPPMAAAAPASNSASSAAVASRRTRRAAVLHSDV